MRLYAVYDLVKAEYLPPFLAKQDATANRDFQQGLTKIPTPNDFELHYLGEIDLDTGVITDNRPHKVIITLNTETDE